eukprot:8552050-Pyramimonas_sp.AAC.1
MLPLGSDHLLGSCRLRPSSPLAAMRGPIRPATDRQLARARVIFILLKTARAAAHPIRTFAWY